VSYGSTPYISGVHSEYLATHSDDQPPLAVFKQAINLVFPTLGGYPPRSLKRKGMPGLSQPNVVRPVTQTLDGANEADSASRPDLGVEGAEKAMQKYSKAVEQTDGFIIYEDRQLQAASQHERVDRRHSLSQNGHVDRIRHSLPPRPNGHLPRQATQQAASSRTTPKDHPKDNQYCNYDTQNTDQPPNQPTSAFQDLTYAWKQLKPGGAFAKQRSSIVPQAARKVDVLAWNL